MDVSVFGTGYVGLIQAAALADVGHRVLCVDIDPNKIKQLQQAVPPISEPGLSSTLEENIKAGRLLFSTQASDAVEHAVVERMCCGEEQGVGRHGGGQRLGKDRIRAGRGCPPSDLRPASVRMPVVHGRPVRIGCGHCALRAAGSLYGAERAWRARSFALGCVHDYRWRRSHFTSSLNSSRLTSCFTRHGPSQYSSFHSPRQSAPMPSLHLISRLNSPRFDSDFTWQGPSQYSSFHSPCHQRLSPGERRSSAELVPGATSSAASMRWIRAVFEGMTELAR